MSTRDGFERYRQAERAVGKPEPHVVNAIAALNSFVRSEAFGQSFNQSRLRKSIYAYKNAVLTWHLKNRLANVRCVYTVIKCRDCAGTGRYVDSMGSEFDHCWKCANSGRVRLVFFETELPNARFHTPFMKAPSEVYDFLGVDRASRDYHQTIYDSAQPTSWEPNKPGEDLAPEQVAAHLNSVEDWFWRDLFPADYTRSLRDYFDDDAWDYFDYHLYVGKSLPQCVFCGVQQGVYHHHRGDFLEWFDYRCKEHAGFERFAPQVADELAQAGSIQRWLARRAGWKILKRGEPEEEIPF